MYVCTYKWACSRSAGVVDGDKKDMPVRLKTAAADGDEGGEAAANLGPAMGRGRFGRRGIVVAPSFLLLRACQTSLSHVAGTHGEATRGGGCD